MLGNWHARFCRPAEGAIPSLSLTTRINRPVSGSGAGNSLSLLVRPSGSSQLTVPLHSTFGRASIGSPRPHTIQSCGTGFRSGRKSRLRPWPPKARKR